MAACDHATGHTIAATLACLTAVDGGPVTGYQLDIKLTCATCGAAFCFLGLPAGASVNGTPMVSFDGLEARLPVMPANVFASFSDQSPTRGN